MIKKQSHKILLVEDNPGDIFLLKEAFHLEKINVDLKVIKDGASALDYLYNDVINKIDIPELIILDLNLPKLNGIEVLQRIKSNEILNKIKTIILSSSRYDEDVSTCLSLGASKYYVKPLDFDDYAPLVQSIEQDLNQNGTA